MGTAFGRLSGPGDTENRSRDNERKKLMTDLTKKHGNVLRIEGIIVMILGILAILLPTVATLGISLLIGVVLLAAGILKLLRTFQLRGLPGFGLSLAGAVLVTVAGIALLVYPWEGVAVLTLILGALFFVEGIGEIAYAMLCRDLPAWRWILVSGIASMVIALLLLLHWPSSAAWAIGLLVGLNLLFTGAWLLAMSTTEKNAPTPV